MNQLNENKVSEEIFKIMKLLTYKEQLNSDQTFGFKMGDRIINVYDSSKHIKEKLKDEKFLSIPRSLKSALLAWDKNFLLLKELENKVKQLDNSLFSIKESDAIILPPIPNPPAFRDFYAFEQHVRAARKLRGLEMNPDW